LGEFEDYSGLSDITVASLVSWPQTRFHRHAAVQHFMVSDPRPEGSMSSREPMKNSMS